MRLLRENRLLRFVIGGGLNTAVTYGIFLLGNLVMPYQTAYLIAYLIGIAFSYFFNSLVVFKAPLSIRKFLAFPLVYVVQYLVSALLLEVSVKVLGVPVAYAPLLIIVITIPLTFVLSRFILARERKA